MRRLIATCALALAMLALPTTAAAEHPSQGNFGLADLDVTFTNQDGTMATQAGSHPFAFTVKLAANLDGEGLPEGWLRDVIVEQVPGLVADTTSYPRCSNADFLNVEITISACPLETQVGVNAVSAGNEGDWNTFPVYNLIPPPGVLVRLGFSVGPANVIVDAGLTQDPPYNAYGSSRNIAQAIEVVATHLQLWGDPSDAGHDELRGSCGVGGTSVEPGEEFEFEGSGEDCPLEARNEEPFLTLPTTCAQPLASTYEAFSWEGPTALDDGFDAGFSLTHNAAGEPEPFSGCGALPPFNPSIQAAPTSRAAQSPTGLDFTLSVKDEGLTNVDGRAKSHIRKAVVTLPEGMTANPSLAEGLEVCSEGDLDDETVSSGPGDGCPEASKIGTLEVESPLLDQAVDGSLYVAEPRDNLADDSLIALYIVLKEPALGIIVKQPVKVEPDPETGQLTTITEEIPQLPFSSFRLKLREGGRSPLISPPDCGTHRVRAELHPWAGGPSHTDTSSFEVISGPNNGPCPSGGTPPFEPGFAAGSLNNAAGAFSPFSMRLTRRDGDQDVVRFDAILPPGVLAKLAGVSQCTDAQIARARAKSGKEELASPSCPPNTQIGRVAAGAGAGSQLTYVPGSVYLAGPFGSAPLSAVAIVPAVAGPFDVGTVVTRQALRVHPRTGVVTADGALSDPIPHILEGIPLAVRDIQVHVERPGFTLNPTSCDPLATLAGIWGGGANPFSLADDAPVALAARYQAASCASLPYKPRLSLRLNGGTRRGAHPALRAVFRPRPQNANTSRVAVRFPRSAFIDQSHFRTICTRVQFAANACPKAAIYGRVRAFTPLLAQPLEGPAYLRSSNNNLPDLVFDLHGLIDFEAVGRIDSIRGGLRATFAGIPDAPLTKVVVNMQGGRKGLFVNSRNLCKGKNRATARLDAHNGTRRTIHPVVRPQCGKRRARGSHRRARG